MTLTLTPLVDIPLVKPGDSLAQIILLALEHTEIVLQDGDILVIAQKIVSKAEGRLVNLESVIPTERAFDLAEKTQKDPRFVELVLQESRSVLRYRPGTLIVEHRQGFVCANAGIDHSNVRGEGGAPEDWVLLLPENADESARRLRAELQSATQTGSLGVLIIDSHGRAWRMGTVGAAIGLAGLPGLVDLRGKSDLFGYQLRVTQVAAADELAAAASLIMGQAAEGQPVVHVRGFPFTLREGNLSELIRPIDMDLFR
ncbi:MAG TPA: coenzyme F420-0:L-glutamate ligase [Anaerolineaceae bacterium]|nr:coenzyme F420-0:L-glutamate ligase [Anaerolineaceae bacterium]